MTSPYQLLPLVLCNNAGPTKTLAKLANHVAKAAERKPGSYPSEFATVCNLAVLSLASREALMAATEVGDVWGVGPRISKQLRDAGVLTALDLARINPALVRERWSVVLERTVRELQGESCLAIEDAPAPKKQIAHTRSFGHPISDLDGLIDAVSSFTVRAAEKLRQQGSVTRHVSVFAHTSPFRSGPNFSRSMVVALPRPTSDTRVLVLAAIRGIKRIYQPGFQLSKAGVMLLDLAPRGSTLPPDFHPFSESASSTGAGFKAMIEKALWWHVCNSIVQT